MANTVECPDCGDQFDARGLPGHIRSQHDRDYEPSDMIVVEEDETEIDTTDDEVLDVAPVEEGADGAIVFRDEIRVTDEQMKRELLETLKDKIRGRDTIEV